jgi:circadian clock protein KaiB
MLRSAASCAAQRWQGTSVAELVLRLYIAGNSASSRRAEQNLRRMEALIKSEGWHVEIIDVVSKPELAEEAGVIATPTLSYEHSIRPRRIVGDLSDTRRVLDFLGIEIKGDLHDRTG